jgi:hypothetical protein
MPEVAELTVIRLATKAIAFQESLGLSSGDETGLA